MDLSNCSGIISVSGDGLFFEILNGLLSRNDWRAAMKIPLGIIPGFFQKQKKKQKNSF